MAATTQRDDFAARKPEGISVGVIDSDPWAFDPERAVVYADYFYFIAHLFLLILRTYLEVWPVILSHQLDI